MTDQDQSTAEALVQSYCGWHIAPSAEDDALTLDGSGGRVLILPSLYVTAVASVSINYGSGPQDLDTSSYDWSQTGMIELRCGCFPDRFRSIVVTMTHGYESMPPDVQAVIDSLSDRGAYSTAIQSRLENVGGIQTNLTYSTATTAGLGLTAIERAVLDRYRLPGLP